MMTLDVEGAFLLGLFLIFAGVKWEMKNKYIKIYSQYKTN
jgi:hypothetical protein